MNKEVWKPVVGYEGLYEASNKGRIKSVPRNGTQGGLMSPKQRSGHKCICLSKDGNKKTIDVHRIVAATFIENPEGLPVINHIDENKHNNSVENLEWCTYKDNVNHGTSIQRMVETRRLMSRKFIAGTKQLKGFILNS